MVALHPYPRGFVIFRRDSSPTLPEGWPTVSLGDSEWNFAHDHLEAPELVTIGDGDRWVLVHGLCLYAGDDERDMTPAHRLAEAAATDESSFLDLLDVLGGRHVVLLGTADGYSLYQDATGMRSVYFSPEAELVGSHAHLLNNLQKHRLRSEREGQQAFIRSWDRTPYVGIHALLPNHSLSVPGMRINRFFPRISNRYLGHSVEERVAEYLKLWERQWQELTKVDSQLFLSVTGGQDSRTTIALLGSRVSDLKTFTYAANKELRTVQAKSLRLDTKIVKQITTIIPMDHRVFRRSPKDSHRIEPYASLLELNTLRGHGSWLIPHYVQLAQDEPSIHIRGNTYGLYKAHWREKFSNGSPEEVELWFLDQTQADSHYEPDRDRVAHIRNGIRQWGYDENLHEYLISDLLYWEIRLGRWASEIYNETDIAFNSLDFTNTRRLLELALSFTIDEKSSGYFQSELVNATSPVLNFPGKNDVRNIYEQYRDSEISRSNESPEPLHPTESFHPLEPTAILHLENGSSRKINIQSGELWIPAEHFIPGHAVTRSFVPTNFSGDLTFTVNNSYSNHLALDTWLFEVLVNGEPKFRWDGAARHRPVHISVNNLQPGTCVSIREVALRDQRGKLSWERASHATVTSGIAHSTPVVGDVTVVADIIGQAIP